MKRSLFLAALGAMLLPFAGATRSPAGSSRGEGSRPVKIVLLGDSITKGVRHGVGSEETFGSVLAVRLKGRGSAAEVVNLGVGGERTDQALARLEREVLSLRP